jgi:hypothetical protein
VLLPSLHLSILAIYSSDNVARDSLLCWSRNGQGLQSWSLRIMSNSHPRHFERVVARSLIDHIVASGRKNRIRQNRIGMFHAGEFLRRVTKVTSGVGAERILR